MNNSVHNSLTSCSAAFSEKPQDLTIKSFQFLPISRWADSAQTAEREEVTLGIFLELVYFRQKRQQKKKSQFITSWSSLFCYWTWLLKWPINNTTLVSYSRELLTEFV